ncbi:MULTISPECIES: hypothetical protein [Paraclostridium]|uniref:Uncharacterized protein n=1 Tax=Paraclostridium bifermentans TaxID=1490 RepID=A0AA44DNN5_PARBF|nr:MULTISPECIES: hypothetical protein [Paraclostridium]MBN8049362.1 hypothetical protein [Paraclostridium bifermentans]MCU9813498.1 hypothetical protein [Paraclostridium sp. AKS81]NME11030.1 hypothetical protein [Paraclostridium bifermentans]TQO57007.1 hypothetical protein D5S05_12215 [Paraclostridium bifermentans]WGX77525.1 hypothetical protein QJS64_19860 [Paraclostridium bifermentans]
MREVMIIKMIIGIFFIVYGLIVSAIEQYKRVPLFYNSKDQVNGVINGFACIVVGIVVSAYNLNQGIIIGIIAFSMWGIEKLIISKILKNKDEKLSNI